MRPLGRKIEAEARCGSFVISHRFTLPPSLAYRRVLHAAADEISIYQVDREGERSAEEALDLENREGADAVTSTAASDLDERESEHSHSISNGGPQPRA